MKKILPILIIGIVVLTGLGAGLTASDTQTTQQLSKADRATHAVFAEDATATWCGYCHYAREALEKIYTSGDYPFYYVCLVDDVNTHAAARIDMFNLYGFPTVFFDGGYLVAVGGSTSSETTYRSYITQSGNRVVPNIVTTLSVTWLGNATMTIAASVQNYDGAQYDGHIRVYVTENESSMGWKDTAGHPYTFPFLDYAFDQDISIVPGGTWSSSVTWDGHNFNDGHGHTFGSIQYGNIMILAAVFNSEWHQGYARPPSSNPFNAYYVDDATGVKVGTNTPPNTPSNPTPSNGSSNIDLNKDLSWTGGDVQFHDKLTYDVYFGTTSPPPKIASNRTTTSYDPGTLTALTTYYWKIVSWDNHGASTAGPIWRFTTTDNPNTPPSAPTITGETSGDANTEYTYTLVATDPEQDTLSYYVDWGDNTTTSWTGPYNSGTQALLNHTWTQEGTYNITAKAKDEHGSEGPLGTLTVTMPLSIPNTPHPLLEWIFTHFPHAFPTLRHLLGY